MYRVSFRIHRAPELSHSNLVTTRDHIFCGLRNPFRGVQGFREKGALPDARTPARQVTTCHPAATWPASQGLLKEGL